MIGKTVTSRQRPGVLRSWTLLLLLPLLALCGRAHASCSNIRGVSHFAGTIAFQPPATIMLSNTQVVGTILWTSSPIPPSNYPTLECSGNTKSGIKNVNAGQPTGSDDTLFPTNVPGLSYRLLHPDTSDLLQSYPNQIIPDDGGNGTSFNVTTALELVVTGTITPGSQLSSGLLGRWVANGGGKRLANFSTSGVTFAAPACTVAVDPTVVTLPTVLAATFSGTGYTTGQTPFNVQLSCQAGANLAITLATSSPQPSTTSVIAPTAGSGYAGNVGVQILNGSGNPITFGTAILEGTTTSGTMSLPFYARYYQTATGVTAGKAAATATYTLTYP